MIRNISNGRVYIGQSKDPIARFKAHARNPPFRMRKDAEKFAPFKEHFELSILQEGLSKGEANRLEESYISLHESTSNKGYNWCFGKPTGCKRWWAKIRSRFSKSHK